MPWFLLYPAIASLLGAGGAKVTGHDWKKGAMLGAGAGLAAGALPLLGGAAAGGNAGWAELFGASQAKGAAAAATAAGASPAQAASLGSSLQGGVNGFGTLAGKTVGSAGKLFTGSAAKNALGSTLASGAISQAMPQYGMTTPMYDPGLMSAPPDIMAELQQLMKKKGALT